MKESYKYYYIDRIMNVVNQNNLTEYNKETLDAMSENDVITIWDTLRFQYGDLSVKTQ